MSVAGQPESSAATAYARWCRYWFEPQETATLALMRIVFGVVVLAWTATLLPDLDTFFSNTGLLPGVPSLGDPGAWQPLAISSSSSFLVAAFAVLVIASICMILGLGGRLTSIVVWLGVLAFTRRNPYVLNSGDAYLRVVAFYFILAPSGASLSLRRWLRERDRFWEFPRRSLWAVRLLQVQVSIVYITACWDKVSRGSLWDQGTALSYILRLKDVARFPMLNYPTDGMIINLMTYGTLAIELSLGVLIWNKRLRPWVLTLGVFLHLIIEYSIRVGFFSLVAIIALGSFVSPASSSRVILAVRDRFRREPKSLPAA